MKDVYFMNYYKQIALLSKLHNKEGLFFAHMLSIMDNSLTVNLNKYQKEQIILAMGIKSKSPSNLARQYISNIRKAGLIEVISGGSYRVIPMANWFGNVSYYLEKHHDFAEISIRVRDNGSVEVRSITGEVMTDDKGNDYVATQDGKTIYL